MKRLAITALLGATVVAGVPAQAAERCHAVATGLPGTRAACEYVADGPGTYVVATASGYSVAIKRGDLPWQTVAVSAAQAATSGPIPSLAGDIVSIGIRTGVVRDQNGTPVATVQDGVIAATE